MNRKQQPKQEQYCEEDWNSVSTIDAEAYWVSKVRHRARTHMLHPVCQHTRVRHTGTRPACRVADALCASPLATPQAQ